MASKPKPFNPLNGMHTAGIFSDMSIDGPEIGTLVVVVDRAKNLPNRKTIGKQDPYTAARLGKEAKKTTTDIRGGQTPKWYVHEPAPISWKRFQKKSPPSVQLVGSCFADLKILYIGIKSFASQSMILLTISSSSCLCSTTIRGLI